ncbi:hypothetical protein EVAR_45927_1 [Eumeta japonica]|uniref:Uncharacterized protein n=1 Tax=Eumeta variegata TaxID=151549 RepID=A0A4C1W8Q2_EUMVA|nr:hypothetical protein EVAR_45927_1 [Eumeta japonica]
MSTLNTSATGTDLLLKLKEILNYACFQVHSTKSYENKQFDQHRAGVARWLRLGFGSECIRFDADLGQNDQRAFNLSQRKPHAACPGERVKTSRWRRQSSIDPNPWKGVA